MFLKSHLKTEGIFYHRFFKILRIFNRRFSVTLKKTHVEVKIEETQETLIVIRMFCKH